MPPPKFTQAKREEYLGHVRAGMRPGAAAEAMGFDRQPILDFAAEDEDFGRQVLEAEAEATEHVEEALYQAAVSGNVTACKLWLDLRQPRSKEMVLPSADAAEPSFDAELAELNKLAAGKK